MNNDTHPEDTDLEAENFSDQLAGEQLRAHLGFKPADPEEIEEDEEESVMKPADPFDDPPKKDAAQRNWLAHGLNKKALTGLSMKKAKRGRPLGSVNKVHQRNKAMKEAWMEWHE